MHTIHTSEAQTPLASIGCGFVVQQTENCYK